MRRKRTGILVLTVLAALCSGVRAAGSEMDDLVALVKDSDLVVVGQVIRVVEGDDDVDAAKLGVKLRTDIAVVAIAEVLKGDPDLKKVEVGFPGFPKDGEVGFKSEQGGIWLLKKSDKKFYEAKVPGRFLRQSRLGTVRRASRVAVGLLVVVRPKPADLKAQLTKLKGELAATKPDAARRVAAYRLGGMGDLRAVKALIRTLDDAAPSVRMAASIALQKITGHRSQVDFKNGAAAVRAQGSAAWRQWWAANEGRTRKDILLAGAKASHRPLPDFQYAVEGLSQYDDAALLPVFRRALDSAISGKNNTLVIAAARYLGRAKDRKSVHALAGLLGKTWPTVAAKSTAAMAVGNITGKDFGSGREAVTRCAKWWAANKTSTKGR